MPIQIKRSAVAGKVPTTAQLELGELAVNTTDGRMFYKQDEGGTERIIETARKDAVDALAPAVAPSYAAANLAPLLGGLGISAAVSTRFEGLLRAFDAGRVSSYFMSAAFTLAPNSFSREVRLTAMARLLQALVVAPRENSTAYLSGNMVVFPSGKVFWANIAGTSAASAPSDAAISTAGSFLADGGVTWEYTGLSVPTSWGWFLLNVASNLATMEHPDSTDAYAGMAAAAVAAASPGSDWLNAVAGFGNRSRMDVIDLLITNSCTDELNNSAGVARLARTFQSGVKGDGTSHQIRYLADNVEVWRGYTAQAALHTSLGNAAEAASAESNADDVRAGVLGLFSGGRFKTYDGQTDHLTLTGNAAFVTDFRFHIWPALHGLLVSYGEWQTYADAVLAYTLAETDGLLTAELDTFPLSEWYWAVGRVMGVREFETALLRRVLERAAANVPIQDVALAHFSQRPNETGDLLIGEDEGGTYVEASSGKNLKLRTNNKDAVEIDQAGNVAIAGGIQTPALTGQVAYFAMTTAPTGWLKCNGAAISRSSYADLFAAIGTTFGAGNGSTTFNLPDLRGEFPRGWDDGRGVDSGRTFGSAQDAAMLNHTHSGTTSTDGSHQHSGGIGFAGIFSQVANSTNNSHPITANTGWAGNHNHTVTTGNPSVGGGNETRPRNVALLACIKY